jgi:hypothetical protein
MGRGPAALKARRPGEPLGRGARPDGGARGAAVRAAPAASFGVMLPTLALVAALTLQAGAPRPAAPGDSLAGPGVSRALAEHRARQIANPRYALAPTSRAATRWWARPRCASSGGGAATWWWTSAAPRSRTSR